MTNVYVCVGGGVHKSQNQTNKNGNNKKMKQEKINF